MPSKFIEEAHANGLAVHPYTMKDDMLQWTDNAINEHLLYMHKQVDGMFTEFPHLTKVTYTHFLPPRMFPYEEQVR